ncbi:MAG TPA: alkaline phosphatase PhoX [Terriglobales bacterium]|nr:alkaline phosphatase PhoX [Terriglobales bacterium]
MTQAIDTARRQTLRLIAGVPLLPLAGSFAGSLLSSTALAAATAKVVSAEFMAMAAPGLDDAAAMATTTVGSSLAVKFADGTAQDYKLQYDPFFISGAAVPDGKGGTVIAGGYYDINNKPILDPSSTEATKPQFFSDCPDGMSLIKLDNAKVEGVTGNPVFAVVQFEYTSRDAAGNDVYGQLPSPIAVLTLDQNKETGALKLVKYSNVDTSGVNGLWITCGASISPWNTHLSSEEYESDATKIAGDKQFHAFSQNLFGDANKANPYHYNHLPEVTVNADGTGSIVKHYCLGRISHELVQVMPDERTVLMGDDATNGGLFMFVADKARDLGAGSLYVAKWNQKTEENGGSADLTWILLGHATSDEIKDLADKLKAADIVEARWEDPNDASFTKIPFSGKTNWVKFVPGQEKAAAFLETHRYAAFKGGSLGFTKMEGTTVNAKDKIAYSAMSYIRKEMTNGSGGISVKGPQAGAVYGLNMTGGQKDDTGAAINSEWVPVTMAAVAELVGEDLKEADATGNLANPDKIANPDNIKFSEKLRTLFIGEDSGLHVNNYLWAFNVDTKKLARILSTPAGAESTGLQAVDEVNGFTYVMSNFQHAGDWELKKDATSGAVTGGLHAKVYEKLEPLIKQNYADSRGKLGGVVGYLTGLPAGV